MKEKWISAKEKWARKMAGKGPLPERSGERLPPGQRLVTDFPVLDLGIRPEVPLPSWSLTLRGKVENPVTLDWASFLALPQVRDVSDFHCVTTWSKFDVQWEGIPFYALCELVRPAPSVRHVFFKGYDGYSTNNPLEACLDDDVLVAHRCNGEPLTLDHGGPARLVLPKRYAWKGAKFIREIIFLERDLLGYWELRGYSNTADPWTEDRFSESPLAGI